MKIIFVTLIYILRPKVVVERSDEDIIREIKAGNKSLFGVLVKKYSNYCYTIAYRILKNKELSEEVSQDAFLSVYQNISLFNYSAAFTTWLYRIVYNKAISETRRKGYHVGYDSIDDEVYNSEITFNEYLIDEEFDKIQNHYELKQILHSALNNIDINSSSLLTLFYLNECTIEEIEVITGLSKSNIKVTLFRGRKKLLEEIKSILGEEYELWK